MRKIFKNKTATLVLSQNFHTFPISAPSVKFLCHPFLRTGPFYLKENKITSLSPVTTRQLSSLITGTYGSFIGSSSITGSHQFQKNSHNNRPKFYLVPKFTNTQQRAYAKDYHNTRGDGFFDMFKKTLKSELEQSEDFQKTKKELEEDNTAKLAKKAAEKVTEGAQKVGENVLKPVGEKISKGAEKVSAGAEIIAQSAPVRKIGEVAEKIGETTVVRKVVEELTEEEREKRKQHYFFRSAFGRKMDKKKGIEYNPYTGKMEKIEERAVDETTTAISVESRRLANSHSLSKFKQALDSAISTIEESNNPLLKVSKVMMKGMSKAADTVGKKLLKPTETAEVLSAIKEVDPTFNLTNFLGNVEYIVIPQVLKAYFDGDVDTIKYLVSERCWSSHFFPRIEGRRHDKVGFDTKILDIRDVELLVARFDADIPKLIISSQIQYIHCLRDKFGKGEIVDGSPTDIRLEPQLWELCIDPTGETKDWEIQDVSFGGSVRIM